MKLNNVIILNRRHLKEFFSFTEFWKKRKEFVDIAYSNLFCKPNESSQKKILVSLIKDWINGRALTSGKGVETLSIILPTGKIKRHYTSLCEKELALLKLEDAFGVVCLYEFMERELRLDIYEVLSNLGYEVFDPTSGVITLQNKSEKEFEQYDEQENCQDSGAKLRNVLIANTSSEQYGYATVRLRNKQINIQTGECIRAIFYGTKCLKLLPIVSSKMKFIFNKETYVTGLSKDGTLLKTVGNVLSFTCGRKGYVYSTDDTDKKFVASHYEFSSEDYNVTSNIEKDELIIYVEMDKNEKKCLFLTDKKNLYLYDTNEGDEIVLYEQNVLMASFVNNELQIIKL